MKSEPEVFSFEDLKARPHQKEPWTGVRNYQARNFMRDQMREGDLVLFYHSSCPVPGVAGLARVTGAPYPDPTQFDRKSEYFDEKSDPKNPRWILVDVAFHQDLPSYVSLEKIRAEKKLSGMRLLQKGNRLSILPVTAQEFKLIFNLSQL